MSQGEIDAPKQLLKKCASHARSQLIACAATSLSLYNHSLPKIHFRGSKRMKSADFMSGLCDECCNTSVHSHQITVWSPDCVWYQSVMMDDDTNVWTSWSLSLNSFSQSVQCTAITSSTDSPVSMETVHQQCVSRIPKAKSYNFTPLVDLFISILMSVSLV